MHEIEQTMSEQPSDDPPRSLFEAGHRGQQEQRDRHRPEMVVCLGLGAVRPVRPY